VNTVIDSPTRQKGLSSLYAAVMGAIRVSCCYDGLSQERYVQHCNVMTTGAGKLYVVGAKRWQRGTL